MSAQTWADEMGSHFQEAEGILESLWKDHDPRSPTFAAVVAEAQVHATLANAAATRLLVETYDGHNTPHPFGSNL